MDALNAYFSPKTNTVYERYVFRSFKKEQGECIEQFVTKLREQGKHCNNTDLDDKIRDQIIEKCLSSELIGLLHYIIDLNNGKTAKRHVDQIIKLGEETPSVKCASK